MYAAALTWFAAYGWLRKSIEEHAQQCFNQVSAKEIVTVALLNPLLEPLRICAG